MEHNEMLERLLDEILTRFAPGDMIPHGWLRRESGIKDKKELRFADFEDETTYWAAAERLQRQYADLVHQLFEGILERRRGWLVSRPGEGYMILPYDEHVSRAYDKFVETLDKSIRRTSRLIAWRPPVSTEQRVQDNDRIARYSWFIQMVPELKK